MPTREQIMAFVQRQLDQLVQTNSDIWVALYLLFLDYHSNVPRITDSNRFKPGKSQNPRIWFQRAEQVERALATALQCPPSGVQNRVDVFMRTLYPLGTQRMNPIGIALACAAVYLIDRFAAGQYEWKLEAKIGVEVFPNLTNFRRSSVDIVAFKGEIPYAVISSKWGIRHDRVRDPQEEADTYKQQEPSLKFYVLTNEFDSARLQKVLTYPTIDDVFHIQRDLVWQAYGGMTNELSDLKDLTELFPLFP